MLLGVGVGFRDLHQNPQTFCANGTFCAKPTQPSKFHENAGSVVGRRARDITCRTDSSCAQRHFSGRMRRYRCAFAASAAERSSVALPPFQSRAGHSASNGIGPCSRTDHLNGHRVQQRVASHSENQVGNRAGRQIRSGQAR